MRTIIVRSGKYSKFEGSENGVWNKVKQILQRWKRKQKFDDLSDLFHIVYSFLCIGPRFLPTLTGLKEQWKTKILKAHQRRRTILKSGQGPRRRMETMLLEMRWWDLLRSSIPVDGDDNEEQEIGDPWWVLVDWWWFRWRCRMVVGDGDKYPLWILKMKVEKKDDYWRGVRKHQKFERNGEKSSKRLENQKTRLKRKISLRQVQKEKTMRQSSPK